MGVLGDSTSAFIAFKKAYGSVRREILHNILIEFGVPMKLFGWLKCVEIKRTGKFVLINIFPIRNDLNHRDILSRLLFNFALVYVCH
jgi:hypothetical protein